MKYKVMINDIIFTALFIGFGIIVPSIIGRLNVFGLPPINDYESDYWIMGIATMTIFMMGLGISYVLITLMRQRWCE